MFIPCVCVDQTEDVDPMLLLLCGPGIILRWSVYLSWALTVSTTWSFFSSSINIRLISLGHLSFVCIKQTLGVENGETSTYETKVRRDAPLLFVSVLWLNNPISFAFPTVYHLLTRQISVRWLPQIILMRRTHLFISLLPMRPSQTGIVLMRS